MRLRKLTTAAAIASSVIVIAVFAQSLTNVRAQTQSRPRYLPEYTASGDLILPKGFELW